MSCPPGSTALWVQLQWAAVYDPSGIQSYEVYLEAIERSPYVYPLQTSTTSYFNVFVPCAEVYRWWVRAIDGVGNVGMGSEARGFSIPDVVAPPAPTLVEPAEGAEIPCSAGGAVTVTLRWNPVTDLTGIVQYEVELVKTPDDAPVPITSTLQITGTQSQTAISGGCGANYRWRVRATDGASNVGEWSAPGTFHILAPPQTSAIFRAFRVVSRYSCSKFCGGENECPPLYG